MPNSDCPNKLALACRLNDLMLMRPKPSPYPLVRIGGDQDGAYLIPDDLQGIRACLSPGVNNTKRFEDDLALNHGIACHMCDFSSDLEKFETPLIEGMQSFRKKWLDVDQGEDSITLDEWVEELYPEAGNDLLLQMDIEGAEYRNLLGCKESTLNRFRIIVIELHDLDAANDQDQFEAGLGPLLRRLASSHLCVHAHPNNCCGEFTVVGSQLVVPRVIELTFLRRDRFLHDKSGESYQPFIPHPLDLESNVRDRPPLLLEGDWIDARSIESESPAGRSTWKKVTLVSKKLDYAIEKFDGAQRMLEYKHEATRARIEYLERLFGELDRPIKLYLAIKRILNPRKTQQ